MCVLKNLSSICWLVSTFYSHMKLLTCRPFCSNPPPPLVKQSTNTTVFQMEKRTTTVVGKRFFLVCALIRLVAARRPPSVHTCVCVCKRPRRANETYILTKRRVFTLKPCWDNMIRERTRGEGEKGGEEPMFPSSRGNYCTLLNKRCLCIAKVTVVWWRKRRNFEREKQIIDAA